MGGPGERHHPEPAHRLMPKQRPRITMKCGIRQAEWSRESSARSQRSIHARPKLHRRP
jgi:hypothetical protein